MNTSDTVVAFTPWGSIQQMEVIADGIDRVHTAYHGGYVLSETRQVEIPAHLTNGTRFYEQDCEARLVELGFPQYFNNDDKYDALSSPSIGIFREKFLPRNDTSEPAPFKSVADLFTDKTPINTRPMNFSLTESERDVIDYLCECVFRNKRPISMPNKIIPTLQDWLKALDKCTKVDGKWPTSNISWKSHFLKTDW